MPGKWNGRRGAAIPAHLRQTKDANRPAPLAHSLLFPPFGCQSGGAVGPIEPICQPGRLMNWSNWGPHMSLRGNAFGASTWQYTDYRLATAIGLILATYAGFFLCLYWLMQPSVSANAGLAAYRPPPKTIVRYADSPWVPPDPSEAFPIRATAEPAPPIAKPSVVEEPKKATKKQEGSTSARRARPVVREQQNPFWGFASSPRSSGSRPWF